MPYQISTSPDGALRWWVTGEDPIPSTHSKIRPPTADEVRCLDALRAGNKARDDAAMNQAMAELRKLPGWAEGKTPS